MTWRMTGVWADNVWVWTRRGYLSLFTTRIINPWTRTSALTPFKELA